MQLTYIHDITKASNQTLITGGIRRSFEGGVDGVRARDGVALVDSGVRRTQSFASHF